MPDVVLQTAHLLVTEQGQQNTDMQIERSHSMSYRVRRTLRATLASACLRLTKLWALKCANACINCVLFASVLLMMLDGARACASTWNLTFVFSSDWCCGAHLHGHWLHSPCDHVVPIF